MTESSFSIGTRKITVKSRLNILLFYIIAYSSFNEKIQVVFARFGIYVKRALSILYILKFYAF